MKMILGCVLVLTGSALLAGQMLPIAQTALIGAFAQAVQDTGSPIGSQAPFPAVAHVSLDNSAPQSSEPHPQGAGSVDVLRETGHQQTLIEQIKPLLAQRAVLVAEREATQPVVPKQLIAFAGEREAKRLVAAQASARAAAKAEIEAQDVALVANVKSVERELAALHERLAQTDANSRTKTDRLRLLQTAKQGSIAGVTLGEARTAVAEVEEHRQDTLVAIAQAEQRLAQAQQDRTKLVRHTRTELEQGLLSTEAQISLAAISLKTSQQVLAALQGTATPPPTASAPAHQAPVPPTEL
jgi:hypothetical protein